jgi:hypothetical protein
MAALNVLVEQNGREVERVRIPELGPVTNDRRPAVFRRKMMSIRRVDHRSLG